MSFSVFSTAPIRFILKIIRDYVAELAKASAIIFVLRVIRLSSPLFTMILMDDVLPNMRRNVLFVVVLAMIGLYVVETILSVFVDWMLFSTTTRLSSHISCDLFSSVFKLPLNFFHTNRTGDTISKLGVTSTLQGYFSEEPVHLVMDTFFGIVFMFFLLYLSPVLTLFSVLMVPVEFSLSYLWTKVRLEKADKAVNLGNMHSGTLVESISGAETIYQTEASNFFQKIWQDEIVEIIKNSVSLKKIDTIFSLIFGFIGQFSNVFIWVYGMLLIMNDELKLGQFIAFTSYIGHLTGPISRLCNLWKDFQATAIAVDKLKEIIIPESINTAQDLLPDITIHFGEIR